MEPVIFHPEYLKYNFGPQHPFSPVRLEMLFSLLDAIGCRPEPIEPEPVDRDVLLTVHSEAFVQQVEAASAGHPLPDAHRYGLGTPDVPVFEGMHEAACHLVGGTLLGARMIAGGQARRVLQLGGGLHHARREEASGFCIYNDLAVAIRYLVAQGLRVAYVDIDVHHGDGVQILHYYDPGVLTMSLHESGQYLFPGTGGTHEIGEAGGKGFKLNVPLEPYTMDDSYVEAFERVVPHSLSWFQPHVLIAVCGADAHYRDPLADLMLTTAAYERLFRRLVELADQYAGGNALFTLAGGYDLDATSRIWAMLYLILNELPLPTHLPEPWRKEWEARLGQPLTPTLHDGPVEFDVPDVPMIEAQNRTVSHRMLDSVARYWY